MQGLRGAAADVLLLGLYATFAFAHMADLIERPRLSVAIVLAFETLLVAFIVRRRNAEETWHSWWTWLTTLCGTFGPMLFRPSETSSDVLGGDLLQLVGLSLQIAAIFSLNRSFGLLPANRGIRCGGLYRFVRHPLYFAYTVAHTGYVINNPTIRNVVVLAAATAFQMLRILNEERLLSRYPAYAAYASSTRWRLLPLVW
jgi:protein-S-isoprenylcysteine O-methyltransferase Ste14